MFFTTGCGGGSAENGVSSGSPLPVTASTSLEIIDDESFNALSEEDKIYVAKKLYSTLYKGIDLVGLREKIEKGNFISEFMKLLYSDTPQPYLNKIYIAPYDELSDGFGSGDAINREKGYVDKEVITRLAYTNLGREYYGDWIAYTLSQTILFSPAWEVDTMLEFPQHVLNSFNHLRERINSDRSIKEIVLEHMISVENWARFRSPEDNGREMLEIWLYDFNDSHVPLAAKALKNWSYYKYFEWPNNKYTFNNGTNDSENNETITLFGKEIGTGLDFYRAVIESESFMPTLVDRIVGRFFPTFDADKRGEIVKKIVDAKPETFKDIFNMIIFSKEYLYNSDKIKSIEEAALGLIHTLEFRIEEKSFSLMLPAFSKSNQKTLTYKLGREDKTPVDTLSFSQFHKYIREAIVLNRDESDVYAGDDGIDFTAMSYKYNDENLTTYLNDIFLDILGRAATDMEIDVLSRYFNRTETYQSFILGNLEDPGSKQYIVMVVLDYLSRLDELYQYRKIGK